MNVVDPAELADEDREMLGQAAAAAEETGKVDLASLPVAVREQLMFALNAYHRGERVAAVASGGKDLSSTEAAELLGMSRTHLARMCDEGRIAHHRNGTHLRISSDEIMRILAARGKATTDARMAAATADQRRRQRAAKG